MSEIQRRIEAIRGLTGAFCLKVQNLELGVLCSQAIDQLALSPRKPLAFGNEAEWAAALIHAVDKNIQPCHTTNDTRLARGVLAVEFEVAPDVISRKSVKIRRLLLRGNTDMEAGRRELQKQLKKATNELAKSARQAPPKQPEEELEWELVIEPDLPPGEFLDEPRPVQVELSKLGEITRAKEKKLQILQLKDQDFMTPYVLLANLSADGGEFKMADRYYERGYIRLNKRLTGADGQWPTVIDPKWTDNVHIIDFLMQRAAWLNERGQREVAIEECRRLIKLCPGDGTGVKLLLALALENMSLDRFNEQYGEGDAMDHWFNSVFEKYPEDFGGTRLPTGLANLASGS